MMRSAFGYGSGRSKTALTMLKIAVFAPIPSARVKIATAENAGLLSNCRKAKRNWFIALLRSERDDRIDMSCAAGRDKTGNQRNRRERDDCGHERGGVERADVIKQRHQCAADCERAE